MITDTIVGAILILLVGAFTFTLTVALVIAVIFIALHAPDSLFWVAGLVVFLLAARRLGEDAHVTHPRGSWR